MIDRPVYLDSIYHSLESNPVVALLGPRQCGKTTLARIVASERDSEYFDLENPLDLSRLSNPMLALGNISGLIVIDEIQRKPELFEILRVFVDRPGNSAKILVLGSAAPRLIKGASESLAGRIGFVDLSGFNLSEVGVENIAPLWHRGAFPRSFLASGERTSYEWRNGFIRTFLERDIPQLGITIAAETLLRFWTMLAHYHGQVWNGAEFARSLGTSEVTARKYFDILSGAYVVRQLQPWHANIKKRQVKSPKIYIRDSGILHALLFLETGRQLQSHPKVGASWEGFVIEEIVLSCQSRNVYFWSTHAGAELDLLFFKGGRATGFEIKYTDAPKTTKSMRIAINDLQLKHLYVVYPGNKTYPLDELITALSINDLHSVLLQGQAP
ncbi:MAG: ATP-binding protein [Desulfobulbaceae bacterium]|nr:ATP-binding protein [Desulfobulbaceae bacterium]